MKKLILLFLASALCLAAIGCGEGDAPAASGSPAGDTTSEKNSEKMAKPESSDRGPQAAPEPFKPPGS
jgi:hypothetical protein